LLFSNLWDSPENKRKVIPMIGIKIQSHLEKYVNEIAKRLNRTPFKTIEYLLWLGISEFLKEDKNEKRNEVNGEETGN
jgi:hypothetical protein